MIKVFSGFKGLSVVLFFIAGIVLLASLFFWGVTKAAELLLPFLSTVSGVLIVVFLCCLLPLTFIKNLRPSLSRYSILMSNVLGVTTWMMSFLFVMSSLGFWGIFFSFLLQFLAPIALLGAMLKGSWETVAKLSLWISFTYGMRFYSRWLSSLDSKMYKKGQVIDVEAVSSTEYKLQ
ncbi:MAG: hypothetical protein WCH62_03340 [Candidatus Omnitrophota bacterium]